MVHVHACFNNNVLNSLFILLKGPFWGKRIVNSEMVEVHQCSGICIERNSGENDYESLFQNQLMIALNHCHKVEH